MERKEIRKSQGGFTLIEIIAVIVLLGVLAAVIVPQFNDLTEEAQQASARQAVAEGIARANAEIAAEILETGGTVAYDDLTLTDGVSGEYYITYSEYEDGAECDGGDGVEVKAYYGSSATGTAQTGYACFPVGTAADDD